MAIFRYRVKVGPDRTLDGEIQAESPAMAISRLEAQGFTPVWVRPADGSASGSGSASLRISRQDLLTFTRQLAGLLKTGVPILRALRTLREQTSDRRMIRMVSELEDRVRNGVMLSDALSAFPRIFPPLFVGMIRAGEAGGAVDEILRRLAQAQEDEDEVRGKVQAALAYPGLVLFLGIVSVVVLLTYFMPKIAELFVHSPQALPWPTRFLIGASAVLVRHGIWVLLGVMVLGVAAMGIWRSAAGRQTVDRILLRLPVIGRFLRDADLARLARTLALLIETGVPIQRALDLSAGALRNSVLRQDIGAVSRNTVQQGGTLAAGLKQQPRIPLFLTHLVAVGEESGRMEEALTEAARFYNLELTTGVRLITNLLEPLLILLVGAVVGFVIFAALLPIFEVGQVL
jgi:type II secretory pathway component PulF